MIELPRYLIFSVVQSTEYFPQQETKLTKHHDRWETWYQTKPAVMRKALWRQKKQAHK